jgi:hypothetical protein
VILQGVDPYLIRNIDLSSNRLGEYNELFYQALCIYAGGG